MILFKLSKPKLYNTYKIYTTVNKYCYCKYYLNLFEKNYFIFVIKNIFS